MLRTVKTENGWVEGLPAADPRITAFKGIPFAAPPVGENRWRAPQPCEDWEGTLLAHQFAPISMQDTPGIGDNLYNREWHVDPQIPMDEDCLYLNVWTGAKSAEEKLPVVIWYFGGGLQWGYPSEMEFDGERVARRGVVVVSVNYRLNVFGFLAHPELTKKQPEAPTNFGSLDQQAGLRWVKRNIAAFGGDPDNVTIAGQSAGGGSVMSQLTSPGNRGQIQKAIVQSAMIRDPYCEGGIGKPEPLESAEKNGESFFEFLGVKTLDEARAIDAVTIRNRYGAYAQNHPRMFTVQDNVFCIGDPLDIYANDPGVRVPMMAGNTEDEFPNFLHAESEEAFHQRTKELFLDKAGEFEALIAAEGTNQGPAYGRVNGIACTVKAIFEQKTKLGTCEPTYYYSFNADIPGWDNPGTFHSVELWFFFETLAKCWRPFVGHHYDLARQMCNYWSNFIKSGDPNGTDADGTPMIRWESYEEDKPVSMQFTANGPVVEKQNSQLHQFLIREIKKKWN